MYDMKPQEVNQGQRAVEKEGNELCPQGGHGERERGMNNVGAQWCDHYGFMVLAVITLIRKS